MAFEETNDNEPSARDLYMRAIAKSQAVGADELAGVLMGCMVLDSGPAQANARSQAMAAIEAYMEPRHKLTAAVLALVSRFHAEAS